MWVREDYFLLNTLGLAGTFRATQIEQKGSYFYKSVWTENNLHVTLSVFRLRGRLRPFGGKRERLSTYFFWFVKYYVDPRLEGPMGPSL